MRALHAFLTACVEHPRDFGFRRLSTRDQMLDMEGLILGFVNGCHEATVEIFRSHINHGEGNDFLERERCRMAYIDSAPSTQRGSISSQPVPVEEPFQISVPIKMMASETHARVSDAVRAAAITRCTARPSAKLGVICRPSRIAAAESDHLDR